MLRDCLMVTKPGIILGNLTSAAAAFLLAARGHVDLGLLAATMAGIGLVIAAACVLNNCIDRDVDSRMRRTCGRALVRGRMTPATAIAYALLLGSAGMALLLAASNGLAAAIVAAGFLIYVGPYSLWLKRRSGAAVVVGSLAGAAPPLAGYCAVSGSLDPGAWMLLALYSFWQMPHFHAIAVYRLDDYRDAGIPVLPLTHGVPVARRHIVVWIAAFLVAALLPGLAGYAGPGYLAVALILGSSWLALALRGTATRSWARRQFRFSILAIFLLNIMMAADFAIPPAWAAGDATYSATHSATIARSHTPYPPLAIAASRHTPAEVRRGEYLVKLGDCLTCHTDSAHGGKPFAGGLKIRTPFGDIYAPNITPDRQTGIGGWSDAQFVRAVRQGIAPDGSYYYPVFPYNYFNRMSRSDVLAIKAYLDAIPAVHRSNHAQALRWPFNYRFLQFAWRLLYFDFSKGAFKPEKHRSRAWNRGAFIVEGPGHCALCHTRLNALGVAEQRYYLAGAFVEDYYAPNITAQGLKHLADRRVADIFLHNRMPAHAGAGLAGPMGEVEHNSLRYLRFSDMLAIAEYLKSVNSQSPPVEVDTGRPFPVQAGKRLYQSTCEACHGNGVMGAPGIKRRVWDVLLDQGRDALYAVAIRGSGDMPPKGGCSACADGRVKAAVDYMITLARKPKHPDTTAAVK